MRPRWANALLPALVAATLVESPSGIVAQTPLVTAADQVRTIAGNGRPGTEDGPAAAATFLMPAGIAIDKDGTIYVADLGAQRIRAISGGVVRTVTGNGEIGPEGLSVPGSYLDGPAAQAQFKLPAGLAIGPDGALYIADSDNACVRKLDRGIVSTVVGKPGESKAIDGAVSVARLVEPRGLAFDRSGNLYIADYEGGLRRFGVDGRLTTVKIASNNDLRIFGVTVDLADAAGTVFASTPDAIVSYVPASGQDQSFKLPADPSRPAGHPYALAALNRRELLFTDVQTASVRYLRLPAPPYASSYATSIVAGARYERPVDNAGFRDGSRAEARFYDPTGIAIQGGFAYVADGGNRRIRRIALPSFRPSEAESADRLPVDATHYEIAYVGSSSTISEDIGDESICADLEAELDRSQRVQRSARCHLFRTDLSTLDAIRDYMKNFVAPSAYNVALLQVSIADVLRLGTTPDEQARVFQKTIGEIVDALKPKHTKLGLVWVYAGAGVSLSEAFEQHETDPVVRSTLPGADYAAHQRLATLQSALRGLDVVQDDTYADFLAYERSPDAVPLFGTTPGRYTIPNPRGNAFLAKVVGKFLLSVRGAM
jgi:hypothetical protein